MGDNKNKLHFQYIELESEVEELRSANTAIREKIGKLNTELKAKDLLHQTKMGKSDAKIKELQLSVGKQEGIIHEKENDLKQLKIEYENLIKESNEYKNQVGQFASLMEAEVVKQTHKNKQELSQEVIQKHSHEIKKIETELKHKQEELETLTTEGNRYKSQIEKLAEEKEELIRQ